MSPLDLFFDGEKCVSSVHLPSYRREKSNGMEEESAVSSRYKVDPSLSNPRSGTSSRSESKSDEDWELLLLRTINLRGVATHTGGALK